MLVKLSNSKFLIPAMVFIVILAMGVGFYLSLKQSQERDKQNKVVQDVFWPNPKQLNDFSTEDHNGKKFGLDNIKGKWSFLFFGYTNCPDICPITMSVMADAYKKLSIEFENFQTIFITVDPERDTTNNLSSYVSYFDKNFIGLKGNVKNESSLISQIGIAYYYNKNDKNYLVDHPASIFLIDPEMRLLAKLSPPHKSQKIINQFKEIKRFVDENN
jgi:protein SCO1/2